MTDTLNNFGETIVNNLTNAAWTDLIIYGIGFIGFCISRVAAHPEGP